MLPQTMLFKMITKVLKLTRCIIGFEGKQREERTIVYLNFATISLLCDVMCFLHNAQTLIESRKGIEKCERVRGNILHWHAITNGYKCREVST